MRTRLLAPALCAGALLLLAPTANASLGVLSAFGSPNGVRAGQVSELGGLAVNRSGAGGVPAGTVYLAEPENRRIQQFDSDGHPIRAFGWNVVAEGPDNVTTASAEQRIEIPASVTGGTFTLTFKGQTTAPIAFNAKGSEVESALEALSTIGAINVNSLTSPFKIVFKGALANKPQPAIEADSTSLVGGAATVTIEVAGLETSIAKNAEQKVEVPASVTAGTFKLTFNGKSTIVLPFNATAAEVKSALAALSSFGSANNVAVTGGPGATAPYTIAFVEALGDTPVPAITVDSSNLSGGSATASVLQEGSSAYEVCDVIAHPADLCQAGETGRAQPGALQNPSAVAVDQQTGNLYVTDSGNNNRVSVYSASGEFEGAFAWGVLNGSRESQFCTTLCLKGIGGKSGSFGERLEGGGAGQFDEQIGHAEAAPAGSPHEGDLYIADANSNRIDEFKPTLSAGKVTAMSFQRAFGWDVAESGPDNIPGANEVQKVDIPASVTAGTFKVCFEGPCTPALPYNASKAQVGNAVGALSSVPKGGAIVVEGGPIENLPFKLTFEFLLGEVNVPQVTVDSSALIGGEAAVTTATQGVSPEQVCDVAAHPTDVCKAGKPGPHLGQLKSPKDVGVDSTGSLYAVDGGGCSTPRQETCRVEKYGPSGAFLGEFSPANLTGSGETAANAPTELALDTSDNHVFVAKKTGKESAAVLELDSSGSLLGISPPGGISTSGSTSGASLATGTGTGEKLYAT